MLAVIWDVEKFRQYLGIKPFKIVTDYMILKTICIVDLLSEKRV